MTPIYELVRHRAAAIAVQESSRGVREEGANNRGGFVHPGDVYVMNWGHIGIVRGSSSGDVVETVDGNQSHLGGGLSLKCRKRNRKDMRVVVRI